MHFRLIFITKMKTNRERAFCLFLIQKIQWTEASLCSEVPSSLDEHNSNSELSQAKAVRIILLCIKCKLSRNASIFRVFCHLDKNGIWEGNKRRTWNGWVTVGTTRPLHAAFLCSLCTPRHLCFSLAASMMLAGPTGPYWQCPSDTNCHTWVLIANFWKRISDSCFPPPLIEDIGSPWSV